MLHTPVPQNFFYFSFIIADISGKCKNNAQNPWKEICGFNVEWTLFLQNK